MKNQRIENYEQMLQILNSLSRVAFDAYNYNSPKILKSDPLNGALCQIIELSRKLKREFRKIQREQND